MHKTAVLIFPNQLIRESPVLKKGRTYYVVEEELFFRQYKFHKQKIVFHRASMKFYENYLLEKQYRVEYIDALDESSSVSSLLKHLNKLGYSKIEYIDPCDDWLDKRIVSTCNACGLDMQRFENPLYITSTDVLSEFFKPNKKRFFHKSFYESQRLSMNLMIDSMGKPLGGKWSFDEDNRKKFPKGKSCPKVKFPESSVFYEEALEYVHINFQENPGEVSKKPLYPINFEQADQWFDDFLNFRFKEFGDYEDAIVKEELILNHSVLSPLLNSGLLISDQVVKKVYDYGQEHDIPINSLEGLIRQLIGWREFIRGMYISKGRTQRTNNYWGYTRKIPASFYTGDTGIEPLDLTIKKVLKTGYCHHIERLMILGNFMLLCEFDPDEVYRWFMELFIDSYDWVMVPNVYGMSQFADGGLMATKPYISGSNYLKKMGDFSNGSWNAIWDGLFWNFMDKHRSFFLSNPRLGMLIRTFDRMPEEKRFNHLNNAKTFLDAL